MDGKRQIFVRMHFPLDLSRLRTLLAAGAVAIAVGVVPATAGAASVTYAGGTISYTTARDETNHLTVAPWGPVLKLTDTGTKGKGATAIAVTAGPGCWQLSTNAAACPLTAAGLTVALGDGDDFFDAALASVAVNVSGGAGNDVLHGGLGADTLDGGADNDSFDARDAAADTLVCGTGTDSGDADALDGVGADCEAVQKPLATTALPDPVVDPQPDPPAPGPITDPTGSTTPTVAPTRNSVPASIPPQTVGVSATGVASVRVACPADSGGCSGTVTLELPAAAEAKRSGVAKVTAAATRRRAPVRLGRAKFTAAAGTTRVIPVRLSKRGRQRILRGRRTRCRIVITSRKADGTTSVATQDVTIRPKRPSAKRGAGGR
jgi:hypothetical protein